MKKKRLYVPRLRLITSIGDVEPSKILGVIVIPIFQENRDRVKYGVVYEDKGGGAKFGFPSGGIEQSDADSFLSSQDRVLKCAKRELEEEMFGGESISPKVKWKIRGVFPVFSIINNSNEKRWLAVVEAIFPRSSETSEIIDKIRPGPDQKKVLIFSMKQIVERRERFFYNHQRVINLLEED